MTTRRIGIGLVGAGYIGHAHAAALAGAAAILVGSGVAVDRVVVADPDSAAGEDVVRRHGFARAVSSWEEVAGDPAVDAVIVASPDGAHRPAVEGLAAAGKHVLCEKPLAVAVTDVAAMVEAVAAAGVVGAVSHEFRRIPAFAAIRWHADHGTLGSILHFHGRVLSDFGHPPADRTTWRFFGPYGSGVVVDVGSHLVDLAELVCGPIAEVAGAQLTRLDDDVERNEDTAVFTVAFARGGVGSFAVSRLAIGRYAALGFDVFGLDGAAFFEMATPGEYRLRSAQDGPGTESRRMMVGIDDPVEYGQAPTGAGAGLGSGIVDWFAIQTAAFVQEVAGCLDLPPCQSMAGELHTARVLDAVVRSAATGGQPVSVGPS